jgi:hypothetical protein
MFKLLNTYICLKKYIKCNIWRVALRPSYIKDAGFLKVKFTIVGIERMQTDALEHAATVIGFRVILQPKNFVES